MLEWVAMRSSTSTETCERINMKIYIMLGGFSLMLYWYLCKSGSFQSGGRSYSDLLGCNKESYYKWIASSLLRVRSVCIISYRQETDQLDPWKRDRRYQLFQPTGRVNMKLWEPINNILTAITNTTSRIEQRLCYKNDLIYPSGKREVCNKSLSRKGFCRIWFCRINYAISSRLDVINQARACGTIPWNPHCSPRSSYMIILWQLKARASPSTADTNSGEMGRVFVGNLDSLAVSIFLRSHVIRIGPRQHHVVRLPVLNLALLPAVNQYF